MKRLQHVRLRNDTGILEELEAYAVGRGRYKLDFSPATILGLASGDVVEVLDPKTGSWKLSEAGENVCLQFFVVAPPGDELAVCDEELATIGGLVDNRRPSIFAATIPRAVGYKKIIETVQRIVRRCPEARCQFGNAIDGSNRPYPGWEGFLDT